MRPILALLLLLIVASAQAREPIPDKLVVLTFDDSVKSHFTVVRPILLKYKFSATFFITEGFDFKTNKKDYMTWGEIAQLNKDGFEIGNHTRDHTGVAAGAKGFKEQIEAINARCLEHGIPRTVSFAYPGNQWHADGFKILKDARIRFARRGGTPEYPYKDGRGVAYEPGLDHPLLIPSAGDARPNWTLDDFRRAVDKARHGRIAVLQFHGVPDLAHPWVHTPRKNFEVFMKYLAVEKFTVIAMRDLSRWVDYELAPRDVTGVIEDRKKAISAKASRDNFRKPTDEADLRRWLQNMVWHHRYTQAEVSAATGLSAKEVTAAQLKFNIRLDNRPTRPDNAPLLVLPYPGGRHPRIGFLDGAIRPQRETKVSVFTPWDKNSYVVVDVPEAIWWNRPGGGRELLYLAHTHIPTTWSRQGVSLKKLEWKQDDQGAWVVERRLPNGVVMGSRVVAKQDSVRMEMWLTNNTKQPMTGLRVQNCVMFKAARGFEHRQGGEEVVSKPYVARRSSVGNRWIITAWDPCQRVWNNPPCPCMHSDPKFSDCAPGQTKRLRGWLSFYEGKDVKAELRRIEATGWRSAAGR